MYTILQTNKKLIFNNLLHIKESVKKAEFGHGNKLDKPLMKRMKILKSPEKYRTSSISVAILTQHFILPSFLS